MKALVIIVGHITITIRHHRLDVIGCACRLSCNYSDDNDDNHPNKYAEADTQKCEALGLPCVVGDKLVIPVIVNSMIGLEQTDSV